MGAAKCMKTCTPSASQICTQSQTVMEPVLQDAVPITNSLYCFTVYTEDTGTTTPNEELPILKYMLSKKTSIFACPEYDVFGDVEVEVGPDLKTIMVTDVEELGMFKQVWKAIGSGD